MNSASPLFSQEPGKVTLPPIGLSSALGSTPEPCSIASGPRKRKKSSTPECGMETLTAPPSGATSPASMVVCSAAELTRCWEDSLVRIYPSPGNVLALARALDQAFSSTSSASQPIAERDSSSWRTSGALFPLPAMFRRMKTDKAKNEQSAWSSEPFPMPGLTLHGSLYELLTLAPLMGGSAGFALDGGEDEDGTGGHERRGGARGGELLLTPTAFDAGNGRPPRLKVDRASRTGEHPGDWRGNLKDVVASWPTPAAGDVTGGGNPKEALKALAGELRASGVHRQLKLRDVSMLNPNQWPTPTAAASTGAGEHGTGGPNIQTAVAAWATPASRDYRHPNAKSYEERGGGSKGEQLPNQIGGALNPAWVEILLGWPIGWSDAANPCPGIWPGWPMGMGPHQHAYEPPRIAPKGTVPNRVARIKACGNGVVPHQQAEAFFTLLSFAIPFMEAQP